jgi:hypothetical protein
MNLFDVLLVAEYDRLPSGPIFHPIDRLFPARSASA